jgi:ribosomal subunit interface protein
VDIMVRGRQVAISDRFREHASTKLLRLERLDGHVNTIDVEVSQEQNPRLADIAIRVELTCRGKGPVVRAEAAADTKFAAFDAAVARLEERLRRTVDRRRNHKHQPLSVVAAELSGGPTPADDGPSSPTGGPEDPFSSLPDDGPMLVKEKVHEASPMTLDDALYEMELVGHDFYLFHDKESGLPSVVYRRRAYDYGVIHLRAED